MLRASEAELLETRKERLDAGRIDRQYPVGGSVLLYTPLRRDGIGTKLLSPWMGPYKVLQQNGTSVTLDLPSGQYVTHVDRLRPSPNEVDPVVPVEVDEAPLLIGEMVIVRHSGRSSYLAKVEALGPDADELTVSCYNSYDGGALKTRRFLPAFWSDVEQEEFFGVNPPVRSDFVPYTNVVYRNQVVVRAVTLTAEGRLVPSVLQQVQSLHLSFKVPARK
jgi:hypothetical protein